MNKVKLTIIKDNPAATINPNTRDCPRGKP